MYLTNSALAVDFSVASNRLVFGGANTNLKNYLSDKKVLSFDRTLKLYPFENIMRLYTLETEYQNLGLELTAQYSSIFQAYENATDYVVELNSYPNDYGTTCPVANLGAAFYRKELDYMNAPKAWDITTGSVPIGLSDGKIKNSDLDFINKTSFINYTLANVPYSPTNIESVHGTGVGAIMAAQGNNGYSSTGVCYDCSIVATNYGNYDNMKALSNNGVKIINMSWSSMNFYYQVYQDAVNHLVNEGVVLIGSAGNQCSYQSNADFQFKYFDTTTNTYKPNFTGLQIAYPASYNGVISVSGIEFYHASGDVTAIVSTSPLFPVSGFVEDSFSGNLNATDINNQIGVRYNGWPRIIQKPDGTYQNISPNGIVCNFTTNEFVDILAPGNRLLDYPKFAEENGIIGYNYYGGTSGSAPFVSGTVGLMRSVNECLTPKEVENILKLTTKDVENMPINQNFIGEIGAGKLEIGDAVVFTNEMKKANGNAVIDNHIFNRFDYELKKINNKLTISNVTFKDNCKATFEARNQIHLLSGTNLKPNHTGNTYLKINPVMDISCLPVVSSSSRSSNGKDENSKSNIILYPNPNNGTFKLINIETKNFGNQPIQLQIFDMNGRSLFKKDLKENDISSCEINLNNLTKGVYFVKLTSTFQTVDIKFIKN